MFKRILQSLTGTNPNDKRANQSPKKSNDDDDIMDKIEKLVEDHKSKSKGGGADVHSISINTEGKTGSQVLGEVLSKFAMSAIVEMPDVNPDDAINACFNAALSVYMTNVKPSRADVVAEKMMLDLQEGLAIAQLNIKRMEELGMPNIDSLVERIKETLDSGKRPSAELTQEILEAVQKREEIIKQITKESKSHKTSDSKGAWNFKPTTDEEGNA